MGIGVDVDKFLNIIICMKKKYSLKNEKEKLLLFKWNSGSFCILGLELWLCGWMLLKCGVEKNSLF